jgi:peptide deformylase
VTLLGIRVLGDPILRQETVPVTTFDGALRRLTEDMFETMRVAEGIGLAAPQVGRTERLTVIEIDGVKRVLVNPEIVAREGTARAEEGCLSIPDIYGDVDRSTQVVARAQDVQGAFYEIEATALLARCIQHEIDHLHGKLFIDYLSVLKRRAALAKWQLHKSKYPGNVRVLTPAEVAAHHARNEEL